METLPCFSENDSVIVTKTSWGFKKEEIANLKIFVLFSLLYLRNNKGSYP